MSSYPLRIETPSGLTCSGIVRVGNFLLILEVPSQTIIHRALRKQSCALNFFFTSKLLCYDSNSAVPSQNYQLGS